MKIIATFFCAFVSVAAFAQTKTVLQPSKNILLTAAQNGTSTTVTAAEKEATVTLQLKDNSGSTGYHWSLAIDKPELLASVSERLIQPERKADDPPMVGVPAVYEYQMKLTGKSGKVRISATLTSPIGKAEEQFVHTINVPAAKRKTSSKKKK